MRSFKLASLLALLGVCLSAHGLGVGPIELRSHLNEPLDARVPLIGSNRSQADVILARLADPDQFSKRGLERSYVLITMQFEVVSKNGIPQYVQIATEQAVREPALNFLVEVSWPNGKVIQEYGVLLDPATPLATPATDAATDLIPLVELPTSRAVEQAAAIPADVEPVPVAVAGADKLATVDRDEPNPSPAALETDEAAMATSLAVAPPIQAAPDEPPVVTADLAGVPFEPAIPARAETERSPIPVNIYGPVTAGDTLWSLAERLRPDPSIGIRDMMQALFLENPEAFSNGDIEGLKQGALLRVPDPATITDSLETAQEINEGSAY